MEYIKMTICDLYKVVMSSTVIILSVLLLTSRLCVCQDFAGLELEDSSSPFYKDVTIPEDDVCSKMMDNVYNGRVISPTPPDLDGLWTSHNCEVRPGPEFVLRHYSFNGTAFDVRQYYYGDAFCSYPIYAVRAVGSFLSRGRSWTTPGGTELEYQLSHVTVTPYTQRAARILSARVNRTCGGRFATAAGPWQPLERYAIFQYVEIQAEIRYDRFEPYVIVDRDCTHAIDWTLHELQLARVEQREDMQDEHLSIEEGFLGDRGWGRTLRMLYLGDIHTDLKERAAYRPMGYQQALYHSETRDCPVCSALVRSKLHAPPSLPHPLPVTQDVTGSWFSERCETRPNGLFVTRRLVFRNDSVSWHGDYHHFTDESCRKPMYTIFASGTYDVGSESDNINGAYHYNFRVSRALVRADDPSMAKTLKKQTPGTCGNRKRWAVGKSHDVTSTGGCMALGITVPHVEYELLRLRGDHGSGRPTLSLGQRPSDGSLPTDENQRPTSFQAPLRPCGPLPKVQPSKYDAYWLYNSAGSVHRTFTSIVISVLMLLILMR